MAENSPSPLRFPVERIKRRCSAWNCTTPPTFVLKRGAKVIGWACDEHARPYPCLLEGCKRAFRTERGRKQHARQCVFDFERPDNRYIPIKNDVGRIVGFCLNDPAAVASLRLATGLLGLNGDVEPVRGLA